MFKTIIKKLYLLGYAVIMYGICRFGYFCSSIARAFLDNKERTVISNNSVTTIGKTHYYYTNIILVISYYLITSIVLILLGIYVVKQGKNKENR